MLPCVQPAADGVCLSLKVQPRASRNQLVGLQGDALKVKLTSPPVDGAANRCCCEYLAGIFSVAKSQVVLVGGEKSRSKKVLIKGVNLEVATAVIASAIA